MQINKTCDELHNGGHYIYSIPQRYSLVGNDCDYSWKQPDGTDLGHESILNHSSCEDGIQHAIRCFNPSNVTTLIFNVHNITTPANTAANMYEVNTTTVPPDLAQSLTSIIIVALIIALGFALLIVVLIRGWRFLQQRSKKPLADVENHPLNTNTNSEDPRDAKVNGSVNGVNQALPLQSSNDTGDESSLREMRDDYVPASEVP